MAHDAPARYDLSREDRFVVDRSLPPRDGPDGPPPTPAPADLDWPAVADRAKRNRVAGLLFWNLRRHEAQAGAPASVLALLRRAYQESLRRGELMMAEIPPVIEAFGEANVPVIVLRGPAAAQALYGDVALRPFTDIDLLVRGEDFTEAKRCMGRAGCVFLDVGLPEEFLAAHHLQVPYVRGPHRTCFELHSSLGFLYSPFTVRHGDLFRMRRSLALGNLTVDAPCPEDDLIAHAIHLVQHCPSLPFVVEAPDAARRVLDAHRLISACDIALAVERLGEKAGWRSIADKADEWNVARELAAAMRFVGKLFPERLDSRIPPLKAPHLSPVERWIFRRGLTEPRRATAGVRGPSRLLAAAQYHLTRGPLRILDAVRYLFPGRPFIRRRYECRSAMTTLGMSLLHPLIAAVQFARTFAAFRRAGKQDL
jgi:hypothetical protein